MTSRLSKVIFLNFMNVQIIDAEDLVSFEIELLTNFESNDLYMTIFTMSESADRAALEVLEIFNWLPLPKYLNFHFHGNEEFQ